MARGEIEGFFIYAGRDSDIPIDFMQKNRPKRPEPKFSGYNLINWIRFPDWLKQKKKDS